MDVRDLVQGSDEWRAARAGSLGASQVSDAIARTKTGWGASRANLQAQLIVERLTGVPQESFSNAAMQWGNAVEPEARIAYEFRENVDVVQVGMIPHPTIEGTHASPDGLVGDDGLLEIKCAQSAGHLAALLGGSIPDKYVVQALWQMACTGRKWCDLAYYDPRMPEEMRLLVRRIERDDARIAELEKAVREFLAEVDRKIVDLRFRYEHPGKSPVKAALEASIAMDAADKAAAQSVVWAG